MKFIRVTIAAGVLLATPLCSEAEAKTEYQSNLPPRNREYDPRKNPCRDVHSRTCYDN
ncbi:hypothetical protein L914_07837 [Phytophthora nicotianae]|uniref:RxLR effector protein n=2 Tax=Phytophthora nicotianae TaxID=4792 RepID=V9F9D3_PHYNI|nr:hypothetical protein F443_08123 [Phytophthora nicotianae P1569]ETM47464.1 hypothetical protein L914_07837 [Phytophthora nicotianae]